MGDTRSFRPPRIWSVGFVALCAVVGLAVGDLLDVIGRFGGTAPTAVAYAANTTTGDEAPGPTTVYQPVHPCTAVNSALGGGRFDPGEVRTVDLVGRCGLGPGVRAVAALVLVGDTGPTAGYVSVWPADAPWPGTSVVNWSGPGELRVASTFVAVSDAGELAVVAEGGAHLAVIVVGRFVDADAASAGRFVLSPPARVLDTRIDGVAPAPDHGRPVALAPSIPDDAVAVIVNITAVGSTGGGDVRLGRAGSGSSAPAVVTTDGPGQTRANGTIVAHSADLVVWSSTGGHVLVDVLGYVTGPSAEFSTDGLFVPVVPRRVLDTRDPTAERLHPDGSVVVPVPGGLGVGGNVSVGGVVATVTGVEPRSDGFVTVLAHGAPFPPTSSLNLSVDTGAVPNLVVGEVGVGGIVAYSSGGTHLLVDVTGYVIGQPVPVVADAFAVENTPPPGPSCEWYPAGRAAIVDRIAQHMWLCDDGVAVTDLMPFTAGYVQAAPAGEYRVFFRRDPWWGSGHTLRRFVAFTRGQRGGRVAFHQYVGMPAAMIGSEQYRNSSAGCFRLGADDSVTVWNFLRVGDPVRVLNNG